MKPAGEAAALAPLLGKPVPDIVFDGVRNAAKFVKGVEPPELRIYIKDNGKATFANFIEASALEYAEGGEMTRDEARERLLAYYAAESDRRATERANVKVELPKIDLAKFKK